MGKIDLENNKLALEIAYEILELGNKTSQWVECGVIKEFESEKVQSKFLINQQ